MTLSDILTYVRARMNESSAITPNWSDAEILQMVENKCNEALSTIGLVDAQTTTVSVSGTDTYSYPSFFLRLRRVWYKGIGLKSINLRQYESRQPSGVKPTGTPREMLLFNNTIYLTPTPNVSGDTITFFGEKQQSTITSVSSTLDVPSVFHPAICDGVIAEMFAKDLNDGFYDRYEGKWTNIHLPSMREFAKRRRKRGMPSTVLDADSLLETEFGLI